MKIATTIGEMYSFSANPVDAIKQYEGTGFRYLDYSFYRVALDKNHPMMKDDWKTAIYEAKEQGERMGFQFVQSHGPACLFNSDSIQRELVATKRSIEACGILGIKTMVMHSGLFQNIRYPDDQLSYCRQIEPFFKALIPEMEKFGVSVLFENSTITHLEGGLYFPIYGRDLNAMIAYMDHPLFGAGWDVGHAHIDGIDQYTEVMEMGKNLKALHIHDNNGNKDQHTAPFLGTLDYDSLMRGLVESGYDGYFTLEADGFFHRKRNAALTGPLTFTPLEVKKSALQLLYTICKTILSTYHVFEE